MNFNADVKLHNKFEMYVRSVDSEEERLVGIAYNMVLNNMWKQLITYQENPFAWICYGRGTGELSPTRTSLFSQIAEVKVSYVSDIIEQVYSGTSGYIKKKITLSTNTAVGETITEVGIAGWIDNYSNRLVTHALLKDAEGNPISFTKTDLDVVTIYATLYCTFSLTAPLVQGNDAGIALDSILLNGKLRNYGRAGKNPLPIEDDSVNCPSMADYTSSARTATRTAYDVVAATETYKARLDTGNANFFIKELQICDFASVMLPENTLIGKVLYEDVPLGVGDDSKMKFLLPSPYVEEPLINVKVNSVEVPFTIERKPRIVLDCNSNNDRPYIYSTSGQYIVAHPLPWDDKWIGNAIKEVQYGKIHRGYMARHASFEPIIGTIAGYPTTGSEAACQPICLNTEKICMLPTDVWFDYTNDELIEIASRCEGFSPISGAVTADDMYLIYFDASGYIRLAKKGEDGKYARVGTSQISPPSSSTSIQRNFITADGDHVVFVAYYGFVIVSIDTVNETITEEVNKAFSLVVGCEYNNKLYFIRNGEYEIYELVEGVFTLTYSGTHDYTTNSYARGGLVGGGWCMISPSTLADAVFIKLLPDGIEVHRPQSPSMTTIVDVQTLITNGGPLVYCSSKNYARTVYVDESELYVVLQTPPTTSETVTATYKTEGVHKSDQYVLDVTFTVNYGEGI